MYPVVAVLHTSRRPEVGFSIVQAVMINVVDYEMVWQIDNLAVHFQRDILFADANPSAGIEGVSAFDGVPFRM